MKKRRLTGISIAMLCMAAGVCRAQNNPGFLGKKIAIGYSSQFSVYSMFHILGKEKTGTYSTYKFLTNNDFYLEYAFSQLQSISASISYQKAPLISAYFVEDDRQIHEAIPYNGYEYDTYYIKTGGFSEVRYLGIGIKYNIFMKTNTVAAPIGFCYYFRFDVNSNKVLNNKYVYDTDDQDPAFKAFALSRIDRKPEGIKTRNMSVGFGAESRMPLSRSFYIRINGECNVSTVGITQAIREDLVYGSYSVNDDLRIRSEALNRLRNLFLCGIGVGVLL